MVTHQQILHFRTFGFVLLRALLTTSEVATLRDEVSGALHDAFGDRTGPARDTAADTAGGISGDYLPLAVARAPLSLALIADDPRTFQISAELLGGPTVPSIGIATRLTGDSSWHTRQGPDVGGVTLWADLEPRRSADSGALRLVPGSHLRDFERRLCEYRAAEPAISGFESWPWPHVVIETEPGDIVAIHAHLLTCALGGTPRTAWVIDYLPWPGLASPEGMAAVRDLLQDAVEFDHETYDRDRWPVWRDWVAGADQIPSRAIAVERLQLLHVLKSDGTPSG
jgi:Phytanoyl-CoA dioxygenase (PhyH)